MSVLEGSGKTLATPLPSKPELYFHALQGYNRLCSPSCVVPAEVYSYMYSEGCVVPWDSVAIHESAAVIVDLCTVYPYKSKTVDV